VNDPFWIRFDFVSDYKGEGPVWVGRQNLSWALDIRGDTIG